MTGVVPRQGGQHPSDAGERICVVGSGWFMTSGISYYTHRLSQTLSERRPTSVILMRRLVPVRFYPGGKRAGQTMHAQAYPSDVPVYDGLDWFALPSLIGAFRFLRRHRPTVVVLQWWTGAVAHLYLALALAAKLLGARIVIEFHEIQDTGEARLPLVEKYTRFFVSRLIKMASGFVVHSEFDRERVRAEYGDAGVDPVSVIPHGPFDQYGSATSDPRDSSDDEPFTFLFFGTIRPYKGLEYLVEAFEDLPETSARPVRLLIVGEPWEGWSAPLELIKRSPRPHRIELVSRYVDDKEVAEYFSRADAVVLPYLRSSASGPLHIAMTFGLPVIVSDVGGLRDGAGGYDGVWWVPPADASSLRVALEQVAEVRGQRFSGAGSWENTAARFAELFAKIR